MGSIRQSEDYHVVIPKFYTEKECKSICELILDLSDELIREHSPNSLDQGAIANGYTGLTSLHSTFNWIPLIEENLGIDLMTRLLNEIDTRNTRDIFIKSWCNHWSTGEGIKPHRHASLEYEELQPNVYTTIRDHEPYESITNSNMISGNIFLSNNDHREYGTWYSGKGWIENIRGDLHLFSPLIVHSVDSNTRTEPRMSQAFDIHIDGHVSGKHLEDKSLYNKATNLKHFLHVEIN
jgi:hypothetical protein